MEKEYDFKPQYKGGNKNSLPAKLAQRIIHDGEERTTSEWSRVLGVTEKKIREACTALRKRGYYIHPIGTHTGNNPKQGVLKFMFDTKNMTEEVDERYLNNHVRPQVEYAIDIVMASVTKYPQLANDLREQMNALQIQFMEQENYLLKRKREYDRKQLADKQS